MSQNNSTSSKARTTAFRLYTSLGIAILSPGLLTGCLVTNKTEIVEEVKRFSDGVMASKVVYSEYYQRINDTALNREELLVSLDRNCKIEKEYPSQCASLASFKSSFDSPYLSSEALGIKLELLGTLSDYADALAKISASKSPQKFQDNVSRLSAAFTSVEGKFATSPSSTKYVGPLANIAGVLGKLYLENLQWNTIRDVIITTSPEVDKLLGFLKTDLQLAENVYDTQFSSTAKNLREFYNDRGRLTLPLSQRQEILKQLSTITKTRRLLASSSPSRSIENLIKVNSELNRLAQGAQPGNIAELRQLLSIYEADLLAVRDAVVLLRQ
ncbi:MAG: hypothetical protein KME02_07910 [Aphanothece saxicola GSE-SYN-MK-01-06B]|jgi:hypothetical protein|nr:hypothetical protein [Aphanothece saxicola GSE-SYN-MK-01-06B]